MIRTTVLGVENMDGYPEKAEIELTRGELRVLDMLVGWMKDDFFKEITACITAKTKIEEKGENSHSITFTKIEMETLEAAFDGAIIMEGGETQEEKDVIKSIHEKIQEQGYTKAESTLYLFHETSRLWLSGEERIECVISLEVHSELLDNRRSCLVAALKRIEPDCCPDCKGFHDGGEYEFTSDELWEIEGALVAHSLPELEGDELEQFAEISDIFDSVEEYQQEDADRKSVLKKIRAVKKKGERVKYTESEFDRRFKQKNG